MENSKQENTEGYYFILAMVFGVLTGWVTTSSILYAFLGAIVGLLFAGLFVNVFVKGRHS
ncbi:hypothetical protein ADIARSV_2769 [Arcticibacter svalbardensis MN12-7]|uniref:Uncharacterized protein n=1 Tax=Arcticibacter svalbardensis MN12-7 TaxID=1150600 RepID=R9GQR3_9SPHI|nr:hypothetical protein [Arcticibacter svalbardensis]EOR94053.1 hypothetical protein ADIARSV_2769 [Arcticibacter svalbardensis MN12-7]